ncbi:pepsin/retropepsin-like aspartic protease family protein [Glycocaulis sp.]|uniref:pepsin/retropepsin-like aspartic protease family protein n=1 Tax=Glycocaulis sp. TaxID=1969725 RepID=UPI003F6FFD6E
MANPVPLSRSADGHAVVELSTPSGNLRLALDTGADTSAMTQAAITRLGLAPASSRNAALAALTGQSRVERYSLSGAQLGALDLPELLPAALPDAPDSRGQLDGFLGLDALAGRNWRIDLAANRLELAPDRPCTPGALSLPAIEGEVNGHTVLVLVDTGLAGSVGNPALGRQLARLPGRSARASVIGADGEAIRARIMRARSFSADGLERRNVDIAIAALPVFETLNLTHRPALFAGMDLLDMSVITLGLASESICTEAGAP